MRTIILRLTLDGEIEYDCQDESTLLVVDKLVLSYLPKGTDIQILYDSIDKSDAPTVWFGSVIDTFLEKLESCPPEFQQVIQDDFWNIVE